MPWNQKTFDFKAQLSKGNKGEHWIKNHYHSPVVKYKERDFDFIRDDGARVEVKTDWYNLSSTEFFFMERWSDVDSKKPGGPWQSEGKADVFIYLFIRDGVYFEFEDIGALVQRLRKLTKGQKLIKVQNKGWCGGGYKVRIEDLKDLYTDYRLFWSVDEVE